MCLVTAALTLALVLPAAAEPPTNISGPASVTDGYTIRVLGFPIRLHGITAPGRGMLGGSESKDNLEHLVGAQRVSCTPDGTKTENNIVAVCLAGGRNIAEQQVEQGHARDCPRLSGGRYATGEARARSAGRDLSRTYPLPSYCLLQ
jgi:micrococcal nuclease